ncbi:hypothetical protein BGX38DRAFT_884532 [Terfezia claveryi]|nr:hypothetical protein BGX38DRAFT_884532 [Terfezia claveryi]
MTEKHNSGDYLDMIAETNDDGDLESLTGCNRYLFIRLARLGRVKIIWDQNSMKLAFMDRRDMLYPVVRQLEARPEMEKGHTARGWRVPHDIMTKNRTISLDTFFFLLFQYQKKGSLVCG